MAQQLVINVLALIVTLGILVTIHEFGHFWVARRCGVKVLRFSIGFGKAVKTWVGRDGTEYVIAPIPLGGYVKMLGQEDASVADADSIPESQKHLSFSSKPLWQRMAIVAAGPVAQGGAAAADRGLVGHRGVDPVGRAVDGRHRGGRHRRHRWRGRAGQPAPTEPRHRPFRLRSTAHQPLRPSRVAPSECAETPCRFVRQGRRGLLPARP